VSRDDATRTVADAMLTEPKVCRADATVATLRDLFTDDHVHCALLVEGGLLVDVVEPQDLLGVDAARPARGLGRIAGRTIAPADDLTAMHGHMLDHGIRRRAVVDADGRLLGLLCLKRSGTGFCSDEGVAARAAERALAGTGPSCPDRRAPV
jgi:CBS domain-containing protein